MEGLTRTGEEIMAKQRKRYYVGLRSNSTVHYRNVFLCPHVPTQGSHGVLYSAVIGPFRTKRGAEFMAKHGHGNPHLQTVADAERLARR